MNDPGAILQRTFDSFTSKLKARSNFILPRRQTIVTGDVAYDCEQFVVQAVGIYQGQPGQNQPGYQVGTHGIALYAMDIGVTLIRSQPNADNTGRPPTGEQLTKASLKATDDAKALTDVFFAAMADNSIMGQCDTVYYGGITWVGPSGGMLGTMLTMAVQL